MWMSVGCMLAVQRAVGQTLSVRIRSGCLSRPSSRCRACVMGMVDRPRVVRALEAGRDGVADSRFGSCRLRQDDRGSDMVRRASMRHWRG